MKTTKVQLKAGTTIELSFATVIEGKEKQVFEGYFPKVMPIVSELGGMSLCSFAVSDSASKLGKPGLGALFQWPNVDTFCQLHDDPRFLEIKGIRDESLSFFTNGHFFEVSQDTEITFREDQSYSIILSGNKVAKEDSKNTNFLANMHSVENTVTTHYHPTNLVITKWDEHCEALLMEAIEAEKGQAEVFKFKVNFPA